MKIDSTTRTGIRECHGACVLRQTHLAEIVADCLRFFDGQRYDLDRFVVMPNHVHAIVQFRQGFSLETISQSWMRYSARQINQQLGSSGAFWQPEPFDHLIRSLDQFEYLQRYIAENPMKAKLKPNECHYWTRSTPDLPQPDAVSGTRGQASCFW